MPGQCPEQIIFERRDDGFYNMTTKIHVVDPDDNESKIKTAYEKCVVELPKWAYGGIPVDVLQQDNVLFTVELLEDEEKTKEIFNDEDIQTYD